MRLFKIAILSLFISHQAFASIKICLSDHIFKEFKSYGESLENAVKMAIEESKQSVIIEKHYFDKTPLAPISAYQNMVTSKCNGIIGFSYLSDLVTLTNAGNLKDIPIISPYGATFSQKLHSTIHLLQPSQDKLARKLIDFVIAKYGNKSISVVTDLRRIEMEEYKKAFQKQSTGKKLKINYIDTIKDEISVDDQKNLQEIIIAFSGTTLAAKIIQSSPKDKIFLGPETFGSKTSPSLIKIIGEKNLPPIYSIRNLTFSNKDEHRDHFYKKYLSKFGIAPSILSVYGYDATKILISMILNKSESYLGLSGVLLNGSDIISSKQYAIVSPSKKYDLIESGVVHE